jgi:hypothetical protein
MFEDRPIHFLFSELFVLLRFDEGIKLFLFIIVIRSKSMTQSFIIWKKPGNTRI